jgi:hypothetical protein
LDVKTLVPIIAIGLVVTACGISRGCQLCTAPSSPTGYAVVLTEKDHAATLRVGEKLEVALRAASGMTSWSRPRSGDESVLAPTVDPAATAARGVTLAAFVARAPGQATLTAAAGPVCSPGQACPMYVMEYTATITVIN